MLLRAQPISWALVFSLSNANLPVLLAEAKPLDLEGGWQVALWWSKSSEDDVKGYIDWPLVGTTVSSI